jgi:hypothetical protein
MSRRQQMSRGKPATRRLFCLAAAAALIWAVAPAGAANADTSLIGWTSQADANLVDFVIDNTAGLAGAHPLAEGDVPEDSSDFETGPFGHGLASIVWPGGTAGNLGSLSGELGLPAQLAPLAAQANDPVRAETFYPAGPSDATYPQGNTSGAAVMVSHADANETTAKSALSDFNVAGLFEVKGVEGDSQATATDTAQASATGSFSSLSILGGLITVGATTSSATATSDGNAPIGRAYTHLGEITIDGHQVSVGTDGITVGPLSTNVPNALAAPTAAQVNQFISAFNVSITPLPVTETNQAPAEQITAGGLKISLALPSDASVNLDCSALNSLPSQFSQLEQLGVLCTLPGFLQGSSLTVTIGRATATAIATPPFPVDLGGNGPTGTGLLGNVGGSSTAAGVAASVSSLPSGSETPSLAGTPVTPAASSGRTPSSTPGGALGALTPASLSEPVKAGLLVALLILAAVAGAGLVGMTRHIPDLPPAGNCPLEEGP